LLSGAIACCKPFFAHATNTIVTTHCHKKAGLSTRPPFCFLLAVLCDIGFCCLANRLFAEAIFNRHNELADNV
jgi:hypothetical protein